MLFQIDVLMKKYESLETDFRNERDKTAQKIVEFQETVIAGKITELADDKFRIERKLQYSHEVSLNIDMRLV